MRRLALLWLLGCGAPKVGAGPPSGGPSVDLYEIDGVTVTSAVWARHIAGLVGEAEGWRCAETDRGGIVSYRQRDSGGQYWEIEEVSDSERPDEHRARRR